MDVSFPTGSGTNGQTSAVVTPTLAYGKGFGHVDVQGTLGVGLPTGGEGRIGRTYTWNNAVQYQLFRKLWPEIEVNATFFQDGKNAGKKQVFVTPGLVVGRIPLTSRLGLTLGAGVQIAATGFPHPRITRFCLRDCRSSLRPKTRRERRSESAESLRTMRGDCDR